MTLIIGGAYSGKNEYVQQHFNISQDDIIDGANCSAEQIYSCRAIKNFQLYVKRFSVENAASLAGKIYEQNCDIIIISNDIGSGIIPMEKSDRLWREETGKTCCAIAGMSDSVIRMCCGIPTAIKGELP